MSETSTALTSVKTGKPNLFESMTCGRCGGSGNYSFNLTHGSMCYGCSGHGIKLTKRGVAAQAFFRQLLSKRADELKVGDKVFVQGFSCSGISQASRWVEVTSVVPSEARYKGAGDTEWQVGKDHGRLDIEGILHNASADQVFRVAATRERKAEAREQALAFQATLTKQGKPSKRKATA